MTSLKLGSWTRNLLRVRVPYINLYCESSGTVNLSSLSAQPQSAMTDKFDAIEKGVGIRVYLSDEPGFAGVVKARYSDFIVHEGKGKSS